MRRKTKVVVAAAGVGLAVSAIAGNVGRENREQREAARAEAADFLNTRGTAIDVGNWEEGTCVPNIAIRGQRIGAETLGALDHRSFTDTLKVGAITLGADGKSGQAEMDVDSGSDKFVRIGYLAAAGETPDITVTVCRGPGSIDENIAVTAIPPNLVGGRLVTQG